MKTKMENKICEVKLHVIEAVKAINNGEDIYDTPAFNALVNATEALWNYAVDHVSEVECFRDFTNYSIDASSIISCATVLHLIKERKAISILLNKNLYDVES